MNIVIKYVSVKTHHAIEQIERYYGFFRKIFIIISFEIFDIESKFELQMTFKIINNSINSHELIFILLIFDAYFQMNELNVSFFTISQRAVAIRKIMIEIKKMNAKCQMKNALNVQNNSFTIIV